MRVEVWFVTCLIDLVMRPGDRLFPPIKANRGAGFEVRFCAARPRQPVLRTAGLYNSRGDRPLPAAAISPRKKKKKKTPGANSSSGSSDYVRGAVGARLRRDDPRRNYGDIFRDGPREKLMNRSIGARAARRVFELTIFIVHGPPRRAIGSA